ncbi:MAG: hypothetical protein ACK5N9_25630, partial [Pirellula sp.]
LGTYNSISVGIEHAREGSFSGSDVTFIAMSMSPFAFNRRAIYSTAADAPKTTAANSTRGWHVGDPINNLTSKGNVPSWSAVRQRFWKNQAHQNASNYSATNLERMQRGLAPQRLNPHTGKLESMELHHTPPQRAGGLFDVRPVWPNEHALIDPFRKLGG